MRQPFYSIVSSIVYLMGAVLFALASQSPTPISIGGTVLESSVTMMLAGLFFLMAYFALVHLKYK